MRRPFDLFIVALAAVQALEPWVTGVPGPRLAVSVAALAWTLPLLWRRRLPFGAPAMTFTVSIAATFLFAPAFGGAVSGLIAMVAAFWVVGAYNDRREALAGAAIGFAAIAVVALHDDRVGPEDAVFFGLVGAAATLIAFTLRRRAQRAAALERREAEIVREREARARAERDRIGRDLHDVIARALGAMIAHAQAARRALEADPEAAREPILAAEEAGREALADLRRLLGLLHEQPATLAPQPGLGDLGALVERAREAGLTVALTVEGSRDTLPPGIGLAAFRIVQEALASVTAPAARVVVRYAPDAVALEIDGPRGDAELTGLRERVALYGGELREANDAVRARLPVPP